MSKQQDSPAERDADALTSSPARGRGGSPASGRRAWRSPSARVTAGLAALMLAVGVGVGAAIGPAPSASLAGVAPGIIQRLPELLAAIAGQTRAVRAAQAPAAAQEASAAGAEVSAAEEAAAARRRRRARRERAAALAAAGTGAPESKTTTTEGAANKEATGAEAPAKKSKLPAISSVWLIELAGESFSAALSAPTDAPYITGTALPKATLLNGWSAPAAAALAGEAALLAPVSAGGAPPLVHAITQPPCPEGAAGTACATPAGQLASADAFLKETLAQITTTAAYREHGLVVVTFASVGVASQAGLPAGASSATLIEKPAAGVAVLSPFAKAGARPTVGFNATSPLQSLEELLG